MSGGPALPASTPTKRRPRRISQPPQPRTLIDILAEPGNIEKKNEEPDTVFTAQDLKTWWILTNGSMGKKEKILTPVTSYTRASSWTSKDTEQLVSLVNTAAQQGTSSVTLKKFLGLFGVTARASLAHHPQTHLRALSLLAEDPSSKVREKLAGNVGLPEQVMIILAEDDSCEIRETVVQHRDVTENVLSAMFQHRDDVSIQTQYRQTSLCEKIYAHPRLRTHDRQEILFSADPTIALGAFRNPNLEGEEISQKWHMMRTGETPHSIYIVLEILRHSNTPAEVLDEYVDICVEKNFTYPYGFHMLGPVFRSHRLASETITKIFTYSRAHPSRSNRTLGFAVWDHIAAHSNTPTEILEWITKNKPSSASIRASDQLSQRKKTHE